MSDKEIKLVVKPQDPTRKKGKISIRNNMNGVAAVGTLRIGKENGYLTIIADGPVCAKAVGSLTIPLEYAKEFAGAIMETTKL